MKYEGNPHREKPSIGGAEKQSKYVLTKLSFLGGGVFATLLVFGLFVRPLYASIGSFLDGLFVKNVAGQTITAPKNSQTLPLLSAPFNTKPTLAYEAESAVSPDGVLIADNGPSGKRPDVAMAPHDQINVYVVREGDTLSEIATMFGVTKETIIWANDLSGGKVKPGQVLSILPVTGIIHTVKKGDTLGGIALKYDIDIEDVIGYNDLHDDDLLLPGDEIIIPNGKLPEAKPAPSTPRSTPKTTYLVQTNGYYRAPLGAYVRTQGIHGSNAVDLAAPLGTPIYAAAGGTVVISKTGTWSGGYGNYVVISHDNGTQTLYAHTQSNAVSVGETVTQGQIVGYVGVSGRVTGPHVHFEVRGAKNPF